MKNRKIIDVAVCSTGINNNGAAGKLLARFCKKEEIGREHIRYIMATGYSRKALDVADDDISETTAHAYGVRVTAPKEYCPGMIIDIGGQDSKIIYLDSHYNVKNFTMNDKCAAGTGKFMEVIAQILETTIGQVEPLSLESKSPCDINSTCVVFAQSEVISLVARKFDRKDILAGMHLSMAKRIIKMMKKSEKGGDILMTGGGALNVGIHRAFEEELMKEVYIAKFPQYNGAIGAALIAEQIAMSMVGFSLVIRWVRENSKKESCRHCHGCGRADGKSGVIPMFTAGFIYGCTPCALLLFMMGYAFTQPIAFAAAAGITFGMASMVSPVFLLVVVSGSLSKRMRAEMPNIALGAWSWGTGAAGGNQIFGNHLFEEDLKPVFEAAMEKGLNLWDTAAVYGEGTSERILGNFVKEIARKDVILSTKFTPQIASDSPDAMQEMLNGSKERLHADVIDVYWIHNPMDVERWTPDLIPLAKSGQIKTIGVSNHNLAEIKRANEILAAEGLKISAVQNHYSLLHRSSERAGILDYCKENGITFYSYMVLEQGALTGRYSEENPFPEGTGRGEAYNPHLKELAALIDELKMIGTRFDASPAQIATAWAVAKGTLPIIGVTKAGQVEEAAKAAQIELSAEEVSRLEKLGDETGVRTLREWEKEM